MVHSGYHPPKDSVWVGDQNGRITSTGAKVDHVIINGFGISICRDLDYPLWDVPYLR